MTRDNIKGIVLIGFVGAVVVANLWSQIAPGYVDIVNVPSAPASPSATCLAGQPCARIYIVGASGGTGATGTFGCKTTSGASCLPSGSPPAGDGAVVVIGGAFGPAVTPPGTSGTYCLQVTVPGPTYSWGACGGGGGISWTGNLTNTEWTTTLTNAQWTGVITN